MARYTFGDDPPAVERLRLVAAAYEPVSRAFLSQHAAPQGAPVLDLGCGPGFSTALLAEVFPASPMVGIDGSAEFLDVARRQVPDATFLVADAARDPLPHTPAGLIYARLLLAHLPEPVAIATSWQRQLVGGGTVVIEDLESIVAPPGPLRAYDEVSAAMVEGGGGVMYAGAALSPLGGTSNAVTVPGTLAARIYLFNVRRWMGEGHDLAELARGLEAVAGGEVSWIVRQVTLSGR